MANSKYLPPPYIEYSFHGGYRIQFYSCSIIPYYLYQDSAGRTTCGSLLAKVRLKKKLRRSKNPTVIDTWSVHGRESNSLSIPVKFFRLPCFFGVNFSKYWLSGACLGWSSYFYLNFIWKYWNGYIEKTHTHFRTPPARSETGFEILSECLPRTDL